MRSAAFVAALAIGTGTAHATPWLDQGGSLPAVPASVEEPSGPAWRLLVAAMLGMRGEQGGVIESGYRISAMTGAIFGPVSVTLAIDQQLGGDNRIPGTEDDPATFSEWVASARVGYRFGIGPDFWITTAFGLARIDTAVTRLATMRGTNRATLGYDAVATVVWRSGRIASTLVVGATAVPTDQRLVIDGATFDLQQRIEPWFGLGVALLIL